MEIMTEQIANFLFKFNKKQKQKQLLVWKSNKAEKVVDIDLNQDCSFIIGYQFEGLDGNDGEFVSITNLKNSLIIQNDRYASYRTYIYEDSQSIFVFSSISDIVNHSNSEITLNNTLLYDYFAFGYLPVTNDTIYKGIHCLQPHSTITIVNTVSIDSKQLQMHTMPENKVSESSLTECLCESIKRKLAHVPLGKSIFCLSSGQDTLLGLLGMRDCGYQADTATWGWQSSKDVTVAQTRHNWLSPATTHFEILLDDVKLEARDFENYSSLLGGVGTSASIYIDYFTRKMIREGKTYHIYCDHYEATRRILDSVEEIGERYTTPRGVIEKYFRDLANYDHRVNCILDSIRSNYKVDVPLEFYFYDRYIKGPFYKNLVVSRLGAIKFTLPIDHSLLHFNHAFIRQTRKLPYKNILKSLMKKQGLNGTASSHSQGKLKAFPFEANSIVNTHKDYFISILECPSSGELCELWDLKKMKKVIYENNLIENEEWFILRLMNLLIFKQKYNLGVG